MTNITCPICEGTDWLNVDEYRLKPDGMAMCTKCAFISYPDIVAKSEELKEFYRVQYRPGPSVNNLFTGQRKLHYHAAFLDELFKKWKGLPQTHSSPAVFEIGAAFGMFLNWVRETFPKGTVQGSELTLAFRRVAFHEYGLELGEEFDDSRKWDLIASYKVAEHVPHIDRELRRYALALKEDGFLYISVPTWFHTMTNFGLDGFSLDCYYDKNHVNVWTRKLFETLLRKSGLEIVKSDYVFYDSTYLCRRNDEVMKLPAVYEEPAKIIEALDRIKKAAMAFDSHDFDGALQAYPAYPEAHIARYEKNRAAFHQLGFDAIEQQVLRPAMEQCPNTSKLTFFAADIAMRYERYERAMEYLKQLMNQKPNDPTGLTALAHCYRALAQRAADPAAAADYMKEARDVCRHINRVSLQHSLESVTWIFADDARIPMPSEAEGKPQ